MGRDKATLSRQGVSYAARLGRVLASVTSCALEVGPRRSGLRYVVEDPPGEGPLAAIVAGTLGLRAGAWAGPVLVLACDLPFMDAGALAVVAGRAWAGSVVPLVAGRAQPLAARWSAVDLDFAIAALKAGERSMKPLLARPGVEFLDETAWPPGLAERAFADVDTPDDLERLGLA